MCRVLTTKVLCSTTQFRAAAYTCCLHASSNLCTPSGARVWPCCCASFVPSLAERMPCMYVICPKRRRAHVIYVTPIAPPDIQHNSVRCKQHLMFVPAATAVAAQLPPATTNSNSHNQRRCYCDQPSLCSILVDQSDWFPTQLMNAASNSEKVLTTNSWWRTGACTAHSAQRTTEHTAPQSQGTHSAAHYRAHSITQSRHAGCARCLTQPAVQCGGHLTRQHTPCMPASKQTSSHDKVWKQGAVPPGCLAIHWLLRNVLAA